MNSSCPSDVELSSLLSSTPPGTSLADLERHLDRCPGCRNRLDRILEDWSRDDAESLRALGAPSEDGSGLANVLRSFASGTGAGATGNPDIQARFEPGNVPGSLGRLADLEILELVASGGMGVVFKARDPGLDRWVALKILAPSLAATGNARSRFLREARAAASIRHENVAAVYSFGEASGLTFIALEYVEGESLARRLARRGPLAFDEVVLLARQVGQGLAAAHAAGIIHRDIKPGNVLMEARSGRAVLTDFGLARAADDTNLTRSGFIVGTPEFLSPEQAAGKPLDERSDLFSLGCLLYAACTGSSPFHAPSTLAVLRKVSDDQPPPMHELRRSVPRWFSDMLETLLAKRPADRFDSVATFLRTLESGVEGRPGPTPVAAHRRRRRGILLLAALAMVASVSAILLNPKPPPPALPFQLRTTTPGDVRPFADLQAALEAAPAGATIDCAWNGPRHIPPIVAPPRPLTIRAAPGFRPVWTQVRESRPGLSASADLTLIGLDWIYLSNTNASPAPAGHGAKDALPPAKPWTGSEVVELPVEQSVIRSSSPTLRLVHCRIRAPSATARSDDGFSAITLDRVGICHIEDSALLMGAGKAFICRGPGFERQLSLMLSNCVVVASEMLWVNTRAEVRLIQSTIQGGTVVFLPGRMEQPCRIDARSNLFHTGFVVIDHRREGPHLLPRDLTWNDEANLYSLTSQPRGGWGYVRFGTSPELGPPRLSSWLAAVPGVAGAESFEGRVTFSSSSASGSAGAPLNRPEDAFRIQAITPDFEDAPGLPPEPLRLFGARVDSVGPEGGPVAAPR